MLFLCVVVVCRGLLWFVVVVCLLFVVACVGWLAWLWFLFDVMCWLVLWLVVVVVDCCCGVFGVVTFVVVVGCCLLLFVVC